MGMLAAMPTAPGPRTTGGTPPTRDGGDACPGALRLHMADDGALARVRIPAGVLSVDGALALWDAARRLGDGSLHLTSRGNVQLRGLGAGCGRELADVLSAAGLLPYARHERVRNFAASPLSGLDGLGEAEVQPWARELDRLLCASESTTGLSGRFLFACDDGRGDMAALGPDVSLTAAGGGALLRLGSAGTALAVRVQDGPRAAVAAAEVFVEAAGSHSWRVAELPCGPDELTDRVAARLTAEGIADERVPVVHGPLGAAPAPGLVVRPSGRVTRPARGTARGQGANAGEGTGLEPYADAGQVASGDHDARSGPGSAERRCSLSVLAPLGRLTGDQWQRLVSVADAHGSGELRLTPWRGVVLPGFGQGAQEQLDALAATGLIASPASLWLGVGACIGRPGCAKSLADVRADARAALWPTGDAPALPVHWSGCERRCGHPRGDHVDVLATADGYDISVRGELRHTGVNPPPARPAPPAPRETSGASELAARVAAARTTAVTR